MRWARIIRRLAVMLFVVAVFVGSTRGQGFLNLNFESASGLPANPGPGTNLPVSDALPGWTVYSNYPFTQDFVWCFTNTFPSEYTPATLEGGGMALDGNWSVALVLDAGIGQTAVVPRDAASIDFEAEGPGSGGSLGNSGFVVTMGGQNLSFSTISDGPDYIEYGANIPANMDGQMEELVLECQADEIWPGDVVLDDIEFSSMSVPEPAEYGLLGSGAILIGLFRKRGKFWGFDRRK